MPGFTGRCGWNGKRLPAKQTASSVAEGGAFCNRYYFIGLWEAGAGAPNLWTSAAWTM